jgi:hypothetical protein
MFVFKKYTLVPNPTVHEVVISFIHTNYGRYVKLKTKTRIYAWGYEYKTLRDV